MCRVPARLDFIILSVPCFTSSNLRKNKRCILLIGIILELAMVLLVMKFPTIYGKENVLNYATQLYFIHKR